MLVSLTPTNTKKRPERVTFPRALPKSLGTQNRLRTDPITTIRRPGDDRQRQSWALFRGPPGVRGQPGRDLGFPVAVARNGIAPLVADEQFGDEFGAQAPAVARGPVDVQLHPDLPVSVSGRPSAVRPASQRSGRSGRAGAGQVPVDLGREGA